MNHHLIPIFLKEVRLERFSKLIMILFTTVPAFSASIDTTTIVIVGTVHNKTEKFTEKTLYNIIERVNPDLILAELDSSFFTQSMSIKSELVNASLENTVVTDYKKTHNILLRPYDIEGRNKIYSDNKYFEQQKELSKSLNKAIQDSLLPKESIILLDAIQRFDQISYSFSSEFPNVVNSTACNVSMEAKQYFANEGMIKIVASVSDLKQFTKFAIFKRDFWIKRNDAMINNILNWQKVLHPKTILVLCGFEHKYYLFNTITKHCTSENFKIKEYWTYNPGL
jgi:hypothetical protein